jgi:hypothetical protein
MGCECGSGANCRSPFLEACSYLTTCPRDPVVAAQMSCLTEVQDSCAGATASVLDSFTACYEGSACVAADAGPAGTSCHSGDALLTCCANAVGDSACAATLRSPVAIEVSSNPPDRVHSPSRAAVSSGRRRAGRSREEKVLRFWLKPNPLQPSARHSLVFGPCPHRRGHQPRSRTDSFDRRPV